jgi:hypothetical protein
MAITGRITASSDGKSGALFQFVLPIRSMDALGSPSIAAALTAGGRPGGFFYRRHGGFR